MVLVLDTVVLEGGVRAFVDVFVGDALAAMEVGGGDKIEGLDGDDVLLDWSIAEVVGDVGLIRDRMELLEDVTVLGWLVVPAFLAWVFLEEVCGVK